VTLVEFEDTSLFSFLKNSIHLVDIRLGQHVYPNYLVRCRFDIAVDLLKSLNHSRHLGTFAVRFSVYPVSAVTTALDDSIEYEDTVFLFRSHRIAAAKPISESRNVSHHKRVITRAVSPNPFCLSS